MNTRARIGELPIRRSSAIAGVALAGVVWGLSSAAHPAGDGAAASQATLGDARVVLGKWIETQQIISKERNDWQQGREVLAGRVELLRNEIAGLEEKLAQAETVVAEAEAKRQELQAQSDQLGAGLDQLAAAVSALEEDVRRLYKSLPEPAQAKLAPLYQRIPDPSATTRATPAERFQNVLVILGELNKSSNEITVAYEVRTLADGKPSEVRALYVGLAQAYYVSARGEAGIGRPSADGWQWEPSQAVAKDVMNALEIIQGKQTPAYVPLPMRIQ